MLQCNQARLGSWVGSRGRMRVMFEGYDGTMVQILNSRRCACKPLRGYNFFQEQGRHRGKVRRVEAPQME